MQIIAQMCTQRHDIVYNIHINKIKNGVNNMKLNNYNEIDRIPNEGKGYNVLILVESLGPWNLTKVKGRSDAWWITGEGIRAYNGFQENYYKLIINEKDFGIDSPSIRNSRGFAAQIRRLIAEGGA
jgi:hypothetical protein